MPRFFYSLRFRLFLLVLLTILPLLTVIGFNVVRDRQTAILAAQDELLDLTKPILQQQEYLIQETRALLTDLSTSPDLQPEDPAACSAFLGELVAQNPQYTNILVATPDGEVFCSGVATNQLVNLADREYFQRTIQTGEFVVGKYIIGRLTGKPLLPLTYPIVQEDGEIAFVLSAGLDLAWLDQLIQNAALPPDATVIILDREAIILARFPDPQAWIGQTIPETALFQAILEQQGSGVLDTPGLDGKARLFAFMPLAVVGTEADLYIALDIPRAVAFAEANRLLANTVLGLSVSTLIGLMFAWFVGEVSILRRTRVLIQAINKMTSGDLTARSNIPRGISELRQLGAAFDAMAESLQRATRALLTLSECNQALVQATSEEELLNEICRLIVEVGGYRMAWVGFAEQDIHKSVRPVAQWGFEEGYLETIKITWADDEWGRGPAGAAIRTGEPSICQDTLSDPGYAPWRDEALACGYAALIALPLRINGRVAGALNIYAAETGAFEEQEIELLTELADDLAYGIASLRARIESQRAVQALREREAKTRLIIEENADGILVLNQQTRILFANPAVERIFLRSVDFLLGREFGYPVTTGQTTEIEVLRREGGFATVEMRAVPFTWEGSAATLVSLRDISQRVEQERQIRQHNRELTLLNRVILAAATAPDIESILNTVCKELALAFEVPQAGAALLDEGRNVLRLVADYREQGHPLALRAVIPIEGNPATQYVFQEKRPLAIEDAQHDPRMTPVHDLMRQRGTVSLMILPLLVGERVVGTIGLDAARPRVFSAAEIALGDSVASTVSQAIERTWHEQAARRRLAQIEALHQIDRAISGSVDLHVTLQVLLEQIARQLRLDAAAIMLLEAHSQILSYAAGRGFRSETLQHTHLRIGEGYAGRAALERRTIHIPDVQGYKTDFLRSPYFSSEGFVAYFGAPLIAKGQVRGVLELFHRQAFEPDPEWWQFLDALATQTAIAIDNATLFESLQRSNLDLSLAYDHTLEGWGRALELRDKGTEGHTQRVTELTLQLARSMSIGEAELVHIRRSCLLHDIGKMGIPDSILHKPGPLSDEEWKLMRQHPLYAYKMLSPIEFLRPALEIPYCHHEKWDGSGYPRGLKGEQIPLPARIFAVVDVFDALTNDRSYREARSREKALEHIREQAGKHFDPQVVDQFLQLMR